MPHLYRFDDVLIDVQNFRMFRAGKAMQLEPKALSLSVFLVENRGRLVAKSELLDAIWNDAFVTENVLTRAIAQLRKALADDPKEPRYIETVPTLGYRFIAELQAKAPEAMNATRAAPVGPDIDVSGPSRRLGRRAATALGMMFVVALVAGAAFWFQGRRSHASTGVPIRSLAVLPLENLSGDASQDYLADGMTDELIAGLGQISALRVISQTTAMQYKNAHKSLPQIARELNVDAVVEGSVARSGDSIRIAAQLVNAPNDKQIWAHTYDGEMRNVLGLQNQVAGAVAEEIQIKLTPTERTQLANTRPVEPRAWEAFFKGNAALEVNSLQSERMALGFFQQAVQIDPGFARAYVGVAKSYNYLAGWGGFSISNGVAVGEATETADSALAKALELDPGLGEAYEERAWTLTKFRWDFPGAEAGFRQALELDLSAPSAHDGLALTFLREGRFDEAVREEKLAKELDPLSLVVNTDYCELLQYARWYDLALASAIRPYDSGPPTRMRSLKPQSFTSEWAITHRETGCGLKSQKDATRPVWPWLTKSMGRQE
jgi:TolB-like protein/DNA-binding winged helix-turn-helix (wHTH) protein